MTLGDELAGWPAVTAGQEPAESQRVKSAWLSAAFSETGNTALHRYFRYHRKRLQLLVEQSPAGDPMIRSGLTELLGFLETYFTDFLDELPPVSNGSNSGKKLPLKLSVAQLACLLRLFYEEGMYPAAGIAEVIRFTAAHYQTKRQEQVSTGSLSKEYYGTSQATAASCLELLEKMIRQLRKNFFP